MHFSVLLSVIEKLYFCHRAVKAVEYIGSELLFKGAWMVYPVLIGVFAWRVSCKQRDGVSTTL
jgi:hypothetical protein